MKRILNLLLLVLLSSCTTNYNIIYMVLDALIMASSSYWSVVRTVDPHGNYGYISPRGKSRYSKVRKKNYRSWVPATSYAISDFDGISTTTQTTTTSSLSQCKSTLIPFIGGKF